MLRHHELLRKMQILIADQDECITNALQHNLRVMGFQQVHLARSGFQAMKTLASRKVHFVITEWVLPQMDGISMVKRIRSGETGIVATIPIIMLTGKGEQQDVMAARDSGINEFVVKPFTAQTLYARIEQLVDHPRPFILSPTYTGPERRRRAVPTAQDARRIRPRPAALDQSPEALRKPWPVILPADFALRQAIGISDPLASIITPKILREAQAAIDALADEATQWVRADIHQLKQALQDLRLVYTPQRVETLKMLALSVKSRAGMFGQPLASDVARLLYLFVCAYYQGPSPTHHLIVQKHIEVLMVIFADNPVLAGRSPAEILLALQQLAATVEA